MQMSQLFLSSKKGCLAVCPILEATIHVSTWPRNIMDGACSRFIIQSHAFHRFSRHLSWNRWRWRGGIRDTIIIVKGDTTPGKHRVSEGWWLVFHNLKASPSNPSPLWGAERNHHEFMRNSLADMLGKAYSETWQQYATITATKPFQQETSSQQSSVISGISQIWDFGLKWCAVSWQVTSIIVSLLQPVLRLSRCFCNSFTAAMGERSSDTCKGRLQREITIYVWYTYLCVCTCVYLLCTVHIFSVYHYVSTNPKILEIRSFRGGSSD